MIIAFDKKAFEDYQAWAQLDKKIFKKVGNLIKEITRTPFDGSGKPEPLKHELSGVNSRIRIEV